MLCTVKPFCVNEKQLQTSVGNVIIGDGWDLLPSGVLCSQLNFSITPSFKIPRTFVSNTGSLR